MIKTTGFKRALLMPSNRRLGPDRIGGESFRGSFTSHGWFTTHNRDISKRYQITSHHVFTNPIFDRMIPSQPRYSVKPETFRRLFQPNLSYEGPYRLFYQK